MPGFLLDMVMDGGLLPHLQKRVAVERTERKQQ